MSESKISKTHVLYSPRYGAGWTTWNSLSVEGQRMLLRHTGMVEAVMAGEPTEFPPGFEFPNDYMEAKVPAHLRAASAQLCADLAEIGCDASDVCWLGTPDLVAEFSPGPTRVNEYDGFESLESLGEGTYL